LPYEIGDIVTGGILDQETTVCFDSSASPGIYGNVGDTVKLSDFINNEIGTVIYLVMHASW
tara:strand:+ start:358 stop:540 length:183 start_codon:yes stop_codon:yes gene_type:complete